SRETGSSPIRPFSPERGRLRQIVADRGGCNAAFAHGMADLVEPDDDIAGRISAGDARPLVVVDRDAAAFVELEPDLLGKLDMGIRAEGRIEAVEGMVTFGGLD